MINYRKMMPILVLVGILAFLFTVTTTVAESHDSRIDPYLQNLLKSSDESEMLPVYIMLEERLSLEYLQSQTAGLNKKSRRQEVIRILKEHAARTQGKVLIYLEAARSRGAIDRIENIWSINVIAFSAKPSVVYDLARDYSEIELIKYDRPISREEAQDDLGISKYNEENNVSLGPDFAPQQGLVLINAPLVWAEGDSGQGVVLANADGGAEWYHPDLANNLWNNLGEDANGNGVTVIPSGSTWIFDPGDINGVDDDNNGKVDDFLGWNFSNNTNDPSTSANSHGTSTAGILVGDGTNGTETGVAPRAKLMDLNINTAGESGWWAAYQYAAENGADVTTSSYSAKWYFSPQPNYPMFRQINDMELAMGTLHTNSTSNDGNSTGIPFNISAPGCTPGPWIHPDQTLVGGISSVIGSANVDAFSDLVVSSSPWGPWAWEDYQVNHPSYPFTMPAAYQDYPYETIPGSMGLIKPDVAAPGNSTTSLSPGGGYSGFSGTSGATPHLAGVAGLMLGINPNLEPEDLSRIMQTTAVEKGDPGKDNRYGAGRVDAYAAYLESLAALQDSLDPEPPTNFVAYSDYLTPTSMALSWDDPTNYANGSPLLPTEFTIEIERDSVSIASVAGGTENYSDMGLNDGQLYDYTIFAKLVANDSTSRDAEASWNAGGSPIPAAPTNLAVVGGTTDAVLTWTDPTTQDDGTPLDDLDSLLVYRNGAVITALVPGVETYTDMPAPGFTYNYTVVAKDDEMPPNLSAPSNTAGAFVGTTPNFLVWVGPTVAALSAVSGDSIFAALVANGESAFLTNNLFEFGNDLSVFEGIFVVLGIYSNNHVLAAADPEGPALEAFLSGGGRIYLEGGDCFNYDPETGGYQIRPWFGLDDGPDGGTDLAGVIGLNDLSAFSFAYNGENSFMDELQPLTSVPVWQNNANADLSGVFSSSFGAGRAIGVVPSFGGFVSSAEALNSSPRIVKTAEPNDAYIEETFKARPISNNQPEFVKKAAWYPELKKSQAELDDILQWTPGGPWIDANNQNDLMAAYVGLFRLQPTPPEIGLSDTVYVDTLLIGGMLDNMLTVSNIGGSFADSLFFTITENPAVGWLSVAPAADTLLANQAVDLTLSLDATGLAAGNYNTTLDVASNDPNHPLRTVSVTLNANDAPTISISPDTFDVTLSAGQTATDTLTISNLGAGPLDWEISAGGVRPELMWYKFDEVGASQTQNYAATGTPVPLTAALMGAISMGGSGQTGAALIGTGGSSGTDYVDTGWITNLGIDSWTIQLWLNNVDNSTTLFYHFGDNTATSFRCFSGGVAGAGNLLLRGPIADVLVTGVAPGPAVVDFVYDATVPEVRAYLNGVLNNTVAQSGVTVVGTAPFKVGGYSTSAGMAAGELMDDFKLFNRALDPGTESSRQEWLTFDTTSGILLPGESYDVTLTFDPTGLVGGEYSQQVVVTSNDPVNPEVSAGAHLVVVGQAAVGHSPAVVTMDTIFTGATDSKSLFVKNTGSDTLRVTGITSTNPLFTVDTTVFNVAPPLDSVEVTVTFSPLVIGTETGYLLVASNDPVTPVDSVDVIGVAVEAPVAVINAQFSNPVQVNSDDSVDVFINMSNSGGSALLWSASLSNAPGTMAAYGRPLFGPVEGSGYADLNPDLQSPPAGMYLDAMWDLQFSYNLEVVTGALGNAGGEFDGMYYYSTRWASNLLHKVDMAGNLVEEFSIAGVTGLRDLAFDGTFMYGGAAANTVYIMDFASKTLIGTIPSPVGVRNISYDEANNGLWLGNWADPPTLIDMSGTTLATLTTGLAGQYGAAYDGYSAGGPYLWVFDQGAGAGTPQIIHQFDLNTLSATGLTYDVTLDFPGTAGIAGGLWVGDGVVAGTASIGGVLQGTPDNFFVYELAVTAAPWISLLANGGSIATGDQFDLPVRVYGVPSDEDTAYVIILTNDPSLPMADVMVIRDLITGIGDQETLPTTYDIAQNYPNPFNPTTTIKYQLPQVSDVKLVIYNVLGQKVRTLVNNRMEAGYHSLVWDGLNQQGSTVASGVYIYHFEAGDFQKTMKLMLLK